MVLETFTLRDGDTLVEVVPARGALVTRLRVAGREVLYLDRATLEDPSKNVRGGIPLLLPFAGRLAGDRFVPAGTTMKQHGFGRNLAWSVPNDHPHSPDQLTMVLEASAATRAQYPYDFRAQHTVQALPRGLQLTLTIDNRGDTALPLTPGWHPYFSCAPAAKAAIRSDVSGLEHSRFTDEREFDFGLPVPPATLATFQVPGLGAVALSFGPALEYLQLWSLPGRDFVCLEPFVAAPDTINTPAARASDLAPGATRSYSFAIDVRVSP
ncbi:MAG: aldose epimerase [Deltaproteobacteria bacterium]|nr:aldose epimerase [Deltaproteobacteria bacterium]